MLKRKKVMVGDVFQILTSEGICYGQVTHEHPKYAFVVAIFRKFFDREPSDFSSIVNQEPQIITTFLIQDAVRAGLFPLVDNVPVADHLSEFPTFRKTNNLKGDETMWWFWDGEKEWRIQRPLTNFEKKYPKGPSLPSAPLLIERVQNDYRVERDYV